MEQNKQEFEHFLSEVTDGYTMQPSSKTWTNIQKNIGTKQKPTAIALILLFLLTSLLLVQQPKQFNSNNYTSLQQSTALQISNSNTLNNKQIVSAQKNIKNNNTFSSNNIVSQFIEKHLQKSKTIVLNNIKEFKNKEQINNFYSNEISSLKAIATLNKKVANKQFKPEPNLIKNKELVNIDNEKGIEKFVVENKKTVSESIKNEITTTIEKQSTSISKIISEDKPESENELELKTMTLQTNDKVENLNTNLQNKLNKNLVFNITKKETKISRKSMAQFYISPGLNFRVLYDKRNNNNNTSSLNTNVSATVFHKPATSIEAGLSWIKPITNKLEFKAGIQSNYNSYKLKVKQVQPQVATISLSGNSQINRVSTLQNAEGAQQEWAENNNLQFSIPVGLNFIIVNNGKAKIGIGSTVQPSYLLKSKMLLLTTDLKNYVEAPYLVRKLNMNGAIEPFVSVKSKNLQWQFGPQLRYQFMSSYSKKYPFKENLFEYGFKLAVSNLF